MTPDDAARADHGATVRDLFRASRPDRLRALLTVADLPPDVARDATRAVKRAH